METIEDGGAKSVELEKWNFFRVFPDVRASPGDYYNHDWSFIWEGSRKYATAEQCLSLRTLNQHVSFATISFKTKVNTIPILIVIVTGENNKGKVWK